MTLSIRNKAKTTLFHYAEYHYAECRVLFIIMLHVMIRCRYAECHYAQCHYAECRYAECCYAECRGAVSGNLKRFLDFPHFFCSRPYFRIWKS